MNPQPRSQQQSDSQEELWAGRSFFPGSPWVAAAGWEWRNPSGPGFSLCFPTVNVQEQSVCPEQKSKEPERVHVDRAAEKGVSRGRSGLERELIIMVMCSYTCASVGEKRDQPVDWK